MGADTNRVIVQRVRCDYRETIADLLLENFTLPWVNWCRARGALTRNEAHGSPGNLLDLYAAADIPETETFGPGFFQIPGLRLEHNLPQRFGRWDPLVYKFASSAANVKGRPLVSSETCTWLGEHFQVALSQVKPEIDRLFTSGINHIFYHGMTYSPARSPWPGWLFYASTDFDPTITIWNDLPELNAYVSRCQSFLQSGLPDNDVLLYFPIYDLWQKEISLGEFEDENRNLLHYFGVHNSESWLSTAPKSFGGAAKYLRARGYSFDYVSDRQLKDIAARREGISAGKIHYRVLLVPECNYVLPEFTGEILSGWQKTGLQ